MQMTAVAGNHQTLANFAGEPNRFDCAPRAPSCSQEARRIFMSTAIFGIVIFLSVGILLAHALDAFRS